MKREGDVGFLKGTTFGVAQPSELPGVLALRKEVYTADLGHDGLDELDDRADHLIARGENGEFIAAFRLMRHVHRPFEMERCVDLGFLDAWRRPAALDRLVIRKDHRQVSSEQFLPLGMLKLSIVFARKHGITDFFILALPHLRGFYRSALFAPCGPGVKHPTWGDVYPMRLDLVEVERQHAHVDRPMARFLFRIESDNFLV